MWPTWNPARQLPLRTRRHVHAWLNDARDDGAWREATVQQMREGEHSYTPEETALIARGMALLGTFATGKGKARPMRRCKTVELAETKHDEKSGLLIGHVEAEVRTSPEQVVAIPDAFRQQVTTAQP